ncbi:MAG: ABC transporter permease [Candidatus Bathyarchaeia archaeon]
MMFTDVLRLAYKALRDRKLRSALTMVMVAIGSGLIIALNSTGAGFSAYVTGQLGNLSPDIMMVLPSSSSTLRLTEGVQRTIQFLPDVSSVIPFVQRSFLTKSGASSRTVTFIGIDQSMLSLLYPNIGLAEGEYVSPSDQSGVLLGYSVAYPQDQMMPFARLGQVITVQYTDLTGPRPTTAQRAFRVVGILRYMGTGGFINVDSMAFVSVTTARSGMQRADVYSGLFVKAKGLDRADAAAEEIRGIYGNNLTIFSLKDIVQIIQNVIGALVLFIGSIAAVSLLVATVGILATMYTSVSERIREIGITKSVGFTDRDILVLFLSEALIIGAVGGLLGLIGGAGLSYAIPFALSNLASGVTSTGSQTGGGQGGGFRLFGGGSSAGSLSLSHMTPVFELPFMAEVWLFCLALAAMGGLYPAWRASKLDPIVALRHE